MDQTTVSDH